jgi:ParB-like chromosome segregation protein Spo0J
MPDFRGWDGAPGIESLLVDVESLSEHPKNPRRGDVEKIKESLSTFGQVRPIVATKQGVVVAGNHTLKAAKALGWGKIAAVLVDLAEDEALAYLIADNRLAEAGGYDNDVLGDVLAELQRDGLLDGTGWSVTEVEELWDQINEDALPLPGDDPVDPPSVDDVQVEQQRQVVILLNSDDYGRFSDWVAHLEEALGTKGMTGTVFEVVQTAAREAGYDG